MSGVNGERFERERQDVHIHASGVDVYRRLADLPGHGDWLAHHFHDFAVHDEDVVSFVLALPGRAESARLRRDRAETEALSFVAHGEGDVSALTWAFHQEGTRDVHLTVEARYQRAGGLFGPLLELLLHRPYRTQALRETLWNLKQLVERG